MLQIPPDRNQTFKAKQLPENSQRNGKSVFELRSILISFFSLSPISAVPPTVLTSLVKAWAEMKPPPVGILDQLVSSLFSYANRERSTYCVSEIKKGL
jgi:hypothetical protein